jgi:glycosyltransferase involved in cell wall biosynthesis
MNIKLISEFFYPDNFRVNDTVKELVARGHTVSVITALPDYETGRIPKRYKWLKNRRETLLGADTVHILTSERKTGAFFRALNYGTFMINSAIYALFCKKPNCDVIMVNETSPIFQVLPGVILKKRTHKKLVLYLFDLWPESLKAWNVKEDSFLFKQVKKFSIWLYRKCDIIAITSKPFRDYLVNVCDVEDEKIVYLPQQYEDEFCDIACRYTDNGIMDVLFAGNIGAVQSLDTAIKAVSLMKSKKPFLLHIVGDGSELKNLQDLANDLCVSDKVIFHGRFPQSEMKEFYKNADCLLLTLSGDSAIGLTLPGKAQGYLCAGKPVIGAINGAGAQLIEESKCGKAVPSGNEKALAMLFDDIAENFEQYKEMGKNGRKYYEENFTKDIFMNSLLKILKG